MAVNSRASKDEVYRALGKPKYSTFSRKKKNKANVVAREQKQN